ncbi:MAG: rubredoxin [Treponema sp.]|nr:rubredoxin [Treponema sp.]
MVWECRICGYVYDQEKGDPEAGIAPGTPFEEIPETWRCPICNGQKGYAFVEKDESEATPQN